MDRDTKHALISMAAASAAGFAVRGLLRTIWRTATNDDPPEDPTSADVGWTEALAWAMLSATVVAVGRTVAKKAAATGWEALDGRLLSEE